MALQTYICVFIISSKANWLNIGCQLNANDIGNSLVIHWIPILGNSLDAKLGNSMGANRYPSLGSQCPPKLLPRLDATLGPRKFARREYPRILSWQSIGRTLAVVGIGCQSLPSLAQATCAIWALSSAVICSQLITVNSSWLKPCCDVTFSYADNSKLSRPIIFKTLRFILANYSTNNIFDSLRNISMNFDVL